MIDQLDIEECFILTHYNVDRMWFITSSKGHTFEEIISKKNVYAIFTGHRHPNQVEIIHHSDKGGLEYCTSSCFDKKRSGLITFDNYNLVYHDVYIPYPGEETKFFLTYPVPNEQISSHHIFNLNQFEIRVISFIKDKNIKLKISIFLIIKSFSLFTELLLKVKELSKYLFSFEDNESTAQTS